MQWIDKDRLMVRIIQYTSKPLLEAKTTMKQKHYIQSEANCKIKILSSIIYYSLEKILFYLTVCINVRIVV